MEDRFTPGAIAGATAAFVQILYGLIIKALHISPYVFTDFGEILIMGKPHTGVVPLFVGATCHIILGSIFGVALSYVIKYTTKRFYLFKGWGVGLTAWVFAAGTGTYFKMPIFSSLPPRSAVVILIGASIYGLTAALTLKLITDKFSKFFGENKVKEDKNRFIRYYITPLPARKLEKKDGKIRLKRPLKLE